MLHQQPPCHQKTSCVSQIQVRTIQVKRKLLHHLECCWERKSQQYASLRQQKPPNLQISPDIHIHPSSPPPNTEISNSQIKNQLFQRPVVGPAPRFSQASTNTIRRPDKKSPASAHTVRHKFFLCTFQKLKISFRGESSGDNLLWCGYHVWISRV